MKYKILKRLKTKTKLIKLCDTLKEAHETLLTEGAKFHYFSYIGGFPIYEKEKDRSYYSIQGLVEGFNVVCSLNSEELKNFNFK